MIKEYIATGKTLEEAMTQAKAGLNAPAKFLLEVKTEVLEMPRKKILGLFGGADAKVRAWYDDGVKEGKSGKQGKKQKQNKKAQEPAKQQKSQPQKQEPKNQPKKEPKKETAKPEQPKKAAKAAPAPKAPKAEPKKEVKTEAKPAPEKAETKKDFPASVDLEYAKSYFTAIVKGLRVDASDITAEYSEGVIKIMLSCEDYGIIIGRRGETLDSIQYLISLAMKKHENAYVRVSIDVGDYREKRNETLRNLARKNAQYVLRTGRRYTFEPMSPYDRRIIHTTVQEIEGAESRSIGYNQERRVVIEPVGGVKKQSRDGGRRDGRRGGRGGAKGTTKAPENYVPKADRADLPKFGKIEVNKD
ncbi:MAG: KH domain-containing protein [Eubacterium sp.]|nr:KH domain-containing protein [Eubacterium sp.]